MTKLQKKPHNRGQPLSPSSSSDSDTRKRDTGTFQALRYESLPQTGSWPHTSDPTTTSRSFPPVMGTNRTDSILPSVATGSAPNFPDRVAAFPGSPVSPINGNPTIYHTTSAPAPAPALPITTNFYMSREQHPPPNSGRTVNKSPRIENSPYPFMHSTELARPVRVAQDMHDGVDPPEYRGQSSDHAHRAQQHNAGGRHHCTKCGKRRDGEQEPSCTRCGKRRSSIPQPSVEVPSAVHTRPISEVQQVQHPDRRSLKATPTTAIPPAPRPAHTCMSCGRYKRPDMPALAQSQGGANSNTLTHPTPAATSRSAPPTSHLRTVQPGIMIEPPSATSPRAPTTSWIKRKSITTQPSPAGRPEIVRKQSLLRSLSHRLSRKKYQNMLPLSSREPDAESTHNLIPGGTTDHARTEKPSPLSARDLNTDRPDSPFSFVGKANENEAFEMSDVKESGVPDAKPHDYYAQDYFSKAATVEPSKPKQEPEVNGDNAEEDIFLALPSEDQSRPGITRFKSLRNSFSRMSSVRRSSSLRRLESVRSVGRAFYRDDVARMEGSEYIAAY